MKKLLALLEEHSSEKLVLSLAFFSHLLQLTALAGIGIVIGIISIFISFKSMKKK